MNERERMREAGRATHRDRLRWALADLSHRQWSRWMKYLFSKCRRDEASGEVTIPAELAERWERQMKTHYQDLDFGEQGSDLLEADKVLGLLHMARVDVEQPAEGCSFCREANSDDLGTWGVCTTQQFPEAGRWRVHTPGLNRPNKLPLFETEQEAEGVVSSIAVLATALERHMETGEYSAEEMGERVGRLLAQVLSAGRRR